MLTQVDVFAANLKKSITAELRERADNLASGSADSYEQYCKSVGVMAGLRLMIDMVEELESRIRNGERREQGER